MKCVYLLCADDIAKSKDLKGNGNKTVVFHLKLALATTNKIIGLIKCPPLVQKPFGNLFSELRFKRCLGEDSEIKMNYILKAHACLDLKTFKSETSLYIDQS